MEKIVGGIKGEKRMTDFVEPYELDYTNEPNTTVKFIIFGEDLQPDEVTLTLGLSPSKSWVKGESIPKDSMSGVTPKVVYPFGQWMLHAPCSKYEVFAVQLEKLLNMLEASREEVQKLTAKYQAGISVANSSGEDNLGFHVEHTTILRMAALGLSLDIIIYPICEET